MQRRASQSALFSGATHRPTSLEMCAGGGGQALGLEAAGFDHVALVETDPNACTTLKLNRPGWNVIQEDLNAFDGSLFRGVDLLAGGLPCPPFSIAGKRLGDRDERNLFPAALRLISQLKPQAVMIENVRGLLGAVFEDFRRFVADAPELRDYEANWRLINACDFGVSQLRPRVIFVALKKPLASHFEWPAQTQLSPPTVGQLLYDLMASRGWMGAKRWARFASEIAPTIVGGSLKHGGPDLGPTRARAAWSTLGVDGLGIADHPPERDFVGMPKLTVRMVARLQGFPDEWQFFGRKTAAYRQVGNAFPPPVAAAVALQIRKAIDAGSRVRAFGAAG